MRAERRPIRARAAATCFARSAHRRRDAGLQRLPIDVLRVIADGRQFVAVAHVVARRGGLFGWWRGPIAAVMNVDHIGKWDVAPRAHPNDGGLDIVDVDADARRYGRAGRRGGGCRRGTHLPHPSIDDQPRDRERVDVRPAAAAVARRRSSVGTVRSLGVTVEPDASDDPHLRVRSVRMDAWILDESPGSYRWGQIDLPELGPDDVRIRVVASALNHMDLWVTRGLPKPPLPARARVRRRRGRRRGR